MLDYVLSALRLSSFINPLALSHYRSCAACRVLDAAVNVCNSNKHLSLIRLKDKSGVYLALESDRNKVPYGQYLA